ncbi:MAG TPA: BON domain-containing protein [Thermoanaerobaculia bacterium]|nr:BON domain-containing protein [Thermoanaerobaculia bacterium]
MKTDRSSPPARPAAAVAVLGFAAILGVFAGCSTTHSLAVDADSEVSGRANGALATAGFDHGRIEACVYRGVVALVGEADETEAREAQRVVSAVPGVVRVNNLVLNEGSSTASGFARAKKAPIIARAGAGQPGNENQ